MVHDEVIALALTLEGIVPMADAEEGFHHVFLHVGAGMLFFLEDLEQGIVLVGAGDSSDNCKGLDPVVSLSGIVRMPVATAVPCHPVDSFYDTFADTHAGVCDFVLTKEGSHPCRSIHCNAVPGGLQQAHVAVVAPVAPVPFPAVEVGDAVLAHLVK